MSNNNLDIKTILEMIKSKTISSEEGYNLIRRVKDNDFDQDDVDYIETVDVDDLFENRVDTWMEFQVESGMSDEQETNVEMAAHVEPSIWVETAKLENSNYKAVLIEKPGKMEDISIKTITPKRPDDKEVQIRVKAFSLNFGDILCVNGLYPTMPEYPFTPGLEVSGTVIDVGRCVSRVKEGDEVIALMGSQMGAHSYIVNTDERFVVKKPENITHEEACAAPVVFLTMKYVFEKGKVKKGDKVLIQTAAGGTGLIAVQLAKELEAEIYATAGSDEKLDYLKSIGLKHLINYKKDDFAQRIMELTDNYGVDVVINTLPGDSMQKGIDILAPEGRYLEIAMTGLKTSGNFNLSKLVNNQSFYSIDLRKLILSKPEIATEYLELMVDHLNNGTIKSTISKIFPFSRIVDAYNYMQNRANIGKVVVTVPEIAADLNKNMDEILPKVELAGGHVDKKDVKKSRDIAIIGMAGRFPGAKDVNQFWDNLASGKSNITEVPQERWDSREYFNADNKKMDKTNCKWGGFLDEIEMFDPLFFSMSGKEAELADPQQRLFLEECWKALEDAGYANKKISDTKCGVFLGLTGGDYQIKMQQENINMDPQSFWGNANSVSASRISYFLNLKGPSVAVDTACSSSLTAIHLGCQSILSGDSDMVIAGGAFIAVTPDFYIKCSNAAMLSADGQCYTFDNRANGFVPGEGVGAVILKSLDAAVQDRDNIYGVIKFSGINQDGKTNGITAPSTISQTNVETEVYRKGNINPETISYIEAHGTGTKLGDPIEIEALTNSFGKFTSKSQYCAIGSVKTNIGHTVAAAGVASVIKVLLSLKNKKIPPSLNFIEKNEHIDFKNSPFFVNTSLKDWVTEKGIPRRAAVSSFGFSGTNVHMVIEEPPMQNDYTDKEDSQYNLVTVSARTLSELYNRAKDLMQWIEKKSGQYFLKDIGYSLNACRTHFPVRSAFVVSNLEELSECLKDLLDNKDSFKNQLEKNVQELKDEGDKLIYNLQSLSADEGQLRRILTEIAQIYKRGYDIEWDLVYKNRGCRRISLPAYPFNRKKFWLAQADGKKNSMELNDKSKDIINPVIDKNISTLKEQKFSKELSGKEFFLEDHVIGQNKMLPGVVYLEMARAAGEIAGENKVRKIKNTIWSKPLVAGNRHCNVQIGLYPDGEDVDYRIWSVFDGNQRLMHAQGKIIYEKSDSHDVELSKIELDSIKKRCTKKYDAKSCYNIFSEMNMNYGTGFRTIKELITSGSETLAFIELPDRLLSNFSDYILHPSIIDGALQSIIGLIVNGAQSNVSYVPYTMGAIEILKPLKEKCLVYVNLLNESKEAVKKFNIQILDESGQILVRINDFSVMPLRAGQIEKTAVDNEEYRELFYTPVWEKSTLEEKIQKEGVLGTLIIFDTDESLWRHLSTRLDNERIRNLKVLLVEPGDEYSELETLHFKINYRNQADYEKLIKVVLDSSLNEDPLHIVHFWSKESFRVNGNNLERQLDKGIYSLFHLCNAIQTIRTKREIRILYAYNGCKDELQPQYEAVSGFAKSIHLENSKINVKTVQVDSQHESLDCKDLEDIFLVELEREKYSETDIKYIDGIRWKKTIKEVETGLEAGCQIIREKGAYIITGGAGGLGLIIAEYLAKQFKARMILVGRTPLSPDKARRISDIISLGGEAVYLQADISVREGVENIVREAKARFKEINGIIHSAGVIKDAYINNKSRRDMGDILAAKVHGTVLLDEATKNEPLDFFVLFSSAASLFGNAGQCDYAFGNSFIDVYSHYRERLKDVGERKGKSFSINWPLWKEGGMKVSKETEAFMKKTMGIEAIDNQTGLKALLYGLSSCAQQLMFVVGNSKKIDRFLGLKRTAQEIIRVDTTESKAKMSETDILKQIHEDLLTEVSRILRLNKSDLDIDSDMSEFGFDSISFTDLANILNDKYNVELMPSIFFEYSSLRAFAEFMLQENNDKMRLYYVKTAEAQTEKEVECQYNQKEDIDIGQESNHIGLESNNIKHEAEQPIAIIGINGVFPQSDDLNDFWDNIEEGKSLITEIPSDRWDWREYYGDPDDEGNKTNIKWGGFLKEVDKFDPMFFGISPREAKMMDPQQRIFIETVWKTIEDAGYKANSLSGTKTGLFVGVSTFDYSDLMKEYSIEYQAQVATGISHSMLANRVSYLFNLRGPSEPIDTACSSSLVAIHRAVQSIRNGECSMAIAGGVNVMASPMLFLSLSKAGMLSSDGRCKTFDKRANGYVRGEGVGAVLLKPLSMAEADGDNIYAVIRGSAVNHGGRANSLTAPNPSAQTDLLVDLYRNTETDPSTVSYIEAHGTGTSLGDPIEINALKKAFDQLHKHWNKKPQESYCGIGTVKTNIGHLEAAAGIASVIKVILAMKNKRIPASINFEELNPYIQVEGSPFYIVTQTQSWKAIYDDCNEDFLRRAGISSFGFGGVNAHVILEDYEREHIIDETFEQRPQVIVLSAKDKERLKECARNFIEYLDCNMSETYTGSNFHGIKMGIQADVLNLTAKVLGVNEYEISIEEDFVEYGFDPVLLSVMAKQISAMYEIELNPRLLSDYPSINSLVNFLFHSYSNIFKKFYCAEPEKNMRIVECPNLSFNDVAYTLQVGREEMNERLAFAATGFKEMRDILEQFCNDDNKDARYNTGNVKNDSERNGLLKEKEAEAFIKSAIEENRLEKLAKWWVSGIRIDWRILHERRKPLRLSLPTYCFGKERYWIGDGKTKSDKAVDLRVENTYSSVKITNISRAANERWLSNYYKPVWLEDIIDLDHQPRNTTLELVKKKKVIIFYSQHFNGIYKLFASCHSQDEVSFVKLGYKNGQVSYAHNELDVFDTDAIGGFIKNQSNIDVIYYLGLTENLDFNKSILEDIDEYQEKGVISLLRLVKSLNKYGWDRKPLVLKVITNNTCNVEDDEIIPYAASIQGMVKGLAKEYSGWKIYGIDISLKDIEIGNKDDILKKVVYPIINWSSEKRVVDIALRNGKSYIRKLKHIQLSNKKQTGFKKNGVYIILGGMGRIGFEMAKYLAQEVGARLVLVGRSSLDAQKQNRISEIEQLGGKAIYIEGSCADYIQLKNIFNEAKREYGAVNGVIHSVMQFNTGTVNNISEDLFKAVMEPKVKACAALEKVLYGETVDFVMFFSSADAFTAILGHSAYVAGCCFEDAFAVYMSKYCKYPVKIINWGYWESTDEQLERLGREGAHLDDSTFRRNGIEFLSPEEGMNAVEHALQNQEIQVIAMKVNDVVLKNLNIDNGNKASKAQNSKSLIASISNHFSRYEKQGILKVEQR